MATVQIKIVQAVWEEQIVEVEVPDGLDPEAQEEAALEAVYEGDYRELECRITDVLSGCDTQYYRAAGDGWERI